MICILIHIMSRSSQIMNSTIVSWIGTIQGLIRKTIAIKNLQSGSGILKMLIFMEI